MPTINVTITRPTIDVNITRPTLRATINKTGPAGIGIPAGGADGQVLIKDSGDDYDTRWGSAAGISELDDIPDVTVTAIASGEVLQWNGSAWINRTLSEAGISSTSHDHDSDYAALVHTHTESEITDLGSYLENIVEDTTPQLGGDLDAQTFDINNVTNIDIEGYADFTEIAVPGDPGAGILRLWALDAGGFGQLHFRNSSGLDYQIARDSIHTVRNNTGSTITKGSWVYITGSTGIFPTVALANADATATAPAMGIVVADIANNSFGQIMTEGDVQDIDTSGFSDGDILYLSAGTAGEATTTIPTGENIAQRIGVVVKSSVGAGIIAVLIGGEFDPGITRTFTNTTIDTASNNITVVEADISDLQDYLTDYTVTEADVTQHEAALTITESQISDLGDYLPLIGGTMTGNIAFGDTRTIGIGTDVFTLGFQSDTGPVLELYANAHATRAGELGVVYGDGGVKFLHYNGSGWAERFVIDSSGNITQTGTINTHTIPGGTGTLALTSDLHDEVTLSGTGTYLSITGQDITVDPITESDISDLSHSTRDSLGLDTDDSPTFAGLSLSNNITRVGDTNTTIQGSSDQWNFVTGASSRFTINNNGVTVSNGDLLLSGAATDILHTVELDIFPQNQAVFGLRVDVITDVPTISALGASTLAINDSIDVTGNIVASGTLNTHTIPGGTGTLALTSDLTGFLENIVEDTTPQLGGNLDLNSFTVGTATAADLTKLNEVTATSAELNTLDGITASVTELNYTDGVTSAIQTQLDGKLLNTTDSLVGDLTITDSEGSPTKQYRFRTSGGALDFDAGGAALYISNYTGADFTGTQRQYMILGSAFDFVSLYSPTWEWKDRATDTQQAKINGDTGAAEFKSIDIASSTVVTGILDEDDLVSDSATSLATQQSIKAYVDAQVGGGGYTDEEAQDAVGTILVDSSEIDFTYTDATPSITASIIAGSIDESKLDTSVNASLDLADSSTQPSDNISTLTNDSGFIAGITAEPLSDLSDVTITTIASGELLKWNGSAWINNTLAEAGIAATSHTHTESEITDLTHSTRDSLGLDTDDSPVFTGLTLSSTLTNKTGTLELGPDTDTFQDLIRIYRNGIETGVISNNANGMLVRAETNTLYLRSPDNTGITVDNTKILTEKTLDLDGEELRLTGNDTNHALVYDGTKDGPILRGWAGGLLKTASDGATILEWSTSGVEVTGNITVSGAVDGLDLATNAMGTVVHGATAGTARPSNYAVVTWIGSVEPTNANNNDIWIDTS